MINIVEYEKTPSKETPHGVDVRGLFESEHMQLVEIRLVPGESPLGHVTPVDVVFYVLEGEGVVEIGDEQAHVSKDTLIESPKGVPHRLMNESEAPFRFLVIKTPGPVATTRFL